MSLDLHDQNMVRLTPHNHRDNSKIELPHQLSLSELIDHWDVVYLGFFASPSIMSLLIF